MTAHELSLQERRGLLVGLLGFVVFILSIGLEIASSALAAKQGLATAVTGVWQTWFATPGVSPFELLGGIGIFVALGGVTWSVLRESTALRGSSPAHRELGTDGGKEPSTRRPAWMTSIFSELSKPIDEPEPNRSPSLAEGDFYRSSSANETVLAEEYRRSVGQGPTPVQPIGPDAGPGLPSNPIEGEQPTTDPFEYDAESADGTDEPDSLTEIFDAGDAVTAPDAPVADTERPDPFDPLIILAESVEISNDVIRTVSRELAQVKADSSVSRAAKQLSNRKNPTITIPSIEPSSKASISEAIAAIKARQARIESAFDADDGHE